jgi:hypothetical protein
MAYRFPEIAPRDVYDQRDRFGRLDARNQLEWLSSQPNLLPHKMEN